MTWTHVVASAAALVSVSAGGAQTPLFKAGVEAVRVDVSVTRGGVPVRNLTAANFVVTDNGASQAITSVTTEQLPLRIVLALDASGSVDGKPLAALVDASRGLLDALHDSDRIALVTFSGEVAIASRFGASRSSVAAALGQTRAGGRTALYDALQAAIELTRVDDEQGHPARPLVIVYSDGVDTGSWIHQAPLLAAVSRAGIVVHAIEAPPGNAVPSFTRAGRSFLADLTRGAGGRTWSATSPRDLKGAFLQTLAEMRDRYLLTFTPATPLKPGWHQLKVTLRNAKGDVLARPGYYVITGGTA